MSCRSTLFVLAMSLAVATPARATFWRYEIKNNSNVDANDLHLVFEVKIHKAKNGVFTDPPKGLGSNTIDWPPPGGSGTVPAGHKMWFKTAKKRSNGACISKSVSSRVPLWHANRNYYLKCNLSRAK